MRNTTDIQVIGASLYFLPIQMRVPLKFGLETVTEVTCARVRVRVSDSRGRTAEGWGETPMSVTWVWPSRLPYAHRFTIMQQMCLKLAEAWAGFEAEGHPIEIAHDFQKEILPELIKTMNQPGPTTGEPMPWLAALVCCSPFDIALHDAYGQLHQRPIYETYGPEFMNHDLAHFLTPANGAQVSFVGKYLRDFLATQRSNELRVWHLVGGLDPL